MDKLQQWFRRRPDFVGLQANERIDGIFVKFTSHFAADQALHDANNIGFGAEWARRNLDMADVIAQAPPPAREHQPRTPPRAPASRHGGATDTITILGIKSKGLDHDEVQDWLTSRPGFVRLQVSDRVDAIFAKFASGDMAERALRASEDRRYGAEWARRNLE